MQSGRVQGLQGTLACWVAKWRVTTAVYVGVADRFRECCWVFVECMRPEMGVLGRVGESLSKAPSYKLQGS